MLKSVTGCERISPLIFELRFICEYIEEGDVERTMYLQQVRTFCEAKAHRDEIVRSCAERVD